MFTAFWMLAAERVPVRKVSRPSASGFWTSSRMRTWPSGLSSARSMRTPLEPTSMTETTAGAPAARAEAAPAGVAGVDELTLRTGLEHRSQVELVMEQVAPLLGHRPFVQGHVAARPRFQHQLGVLRLGGNRPDPLAM